MENIDINLVVSKLPEYLNWVHMGAISDSENKWLFIDLEKDILNSILSYLSDEKKQDKERLKERLSKVIEEEL